MAVASYLINDWDVCVAPVYSSSTGWVGSHSMGKLLKKGVKGDRSTETKGDAE